MTKPQKAILGWSATITGLICFGIMGYTIYDSLPPPLPPQPPQQFENSQRPPPPKQERSPPKRERRRTRPNTTSHVTTLRTGDGHDFLALSYRDKAELCNLIARTLKVKTGSYYLNFLNEYYLLLPDDEVALTIPILHVAAAAAAWKDE